jgi:hypothetical protein
VQTARPGSPLPAAVVGPITGCVINLKNKAGARGGQKFKKCLILLVPGESIELPTNGLQSRSYSAFRWRSQPSPQTNGRSSWSRSSFWYMTGSDPINGVEERALSTGL